MEGELRSYFAPLMAQFDATLRHLYLAGLWGSARANVTMNSKSYSLDEIVQDLYFQDGLRRVLVASPLVSV